MNRAKRTAAIGLEGTTVVNVDLVAAHGLARAVVDLFNDFDVERLLKGESQRQESDQSGEKAHCDSDDSGRNELG